MAVLAVVGLAFGLRLAIADHPYLAQWDEAYHALVAKNFLDHPLRPVLLKELPPELDIHFWGRTTLWLHKPPLAMWLMAFSMWFLGDGELALRLPSVLADSMLTLIIILMTARLAGRGVALAAGLVWALNGGPLLTVAGFSPTDHPDAMLLFFSNAALFAYVRGRNEADLRHRARFALIYGACCAFAYLAKGLASAPVLIVPPVFEIASWWHGGRRSPLRREALIPFFSAFAGMTIALPWAIYSQIHYGDILAAERAYDLRHFTEALEGHAYGPLRHFEVIAANTVGSEGTAAGVIGITLVLAAVLTGWRAGGALRIMAAWLALYFVVYTGAVTRMRNYCLPAYPALIILIARLVAVDLARLRAECGGLLASQRGIIMTAALALLVICSLINTGFILHREEIPSSLEGQSSHYLYSDMRRQMKAISADRRRGLIWNLRDGDWVQGSFNGIQSYEAAIHASFYSGKTALAAEPTREGLLRAHDRGLHNWIAVPYRIGAEEIGQIKKMADGLPVSIVKINLKSDPPVRAEVMR